MPPKKRRASGANRNKRPKTPKTNLPVYKWAAWGQHIIDRNRFVDAGACMCSEGVCSAGAVYDRFARKCTIPKNTGTNPTYRYLNYCEHDRLVVVDQNARVSPRKFRVPPLVPIPDDVDQRFTAGERLAGGYYSSREEWCAACEEYSPFEVVPLDILKLILGQFKTHAYWCCGTQWAALSLVCRLWYYVVNGCAVREPCEWPRTSSFADVIIEDAKKTGEHITFWYTKRYMQDEYRRKLNKTYLPFTRTQVNDVYLRLIPVILVSGRFVETERYDMYLDVLSRVSPDVQSAILEKTPRTFLINTRHGSALVITDLVRKKQGRFIDVYNIILSLPYMRTNMHSFVFPFAYFCNNEADAKERNVKAAEMAQTYLRYTDFPRREMCLAEMARTFIEHIEDPSAAIDLIVESGVINPSTIVDHSNNTNLCDTIALNIGKFSDEFVLKHKEKINTQFIHDLINNRAIGNNALEGLIQKNIIKPTPEMFFSYTLDVDIIHLIFMSLTEDERNHICPTWRKHVD